MLFREALRKQAFFAQQKNAHTATVMLFALLTTAASVNCWPDEEMFHAGR
jgi:hypothetical protein